MKAEAQGFRPSIVSGIPLGVGLNATIDVKLELGTVSGAIHGKRVTNSSAVVAKIDHILNDRHRWFGRVFTRDSNSFPPSLGEENAAFPAHSTSTIPPRSAIVNLTSTFTPNLLGELRVSYTWFQYNDSWVAKGSMPSRRDFRKSLARGSSTSRPARPLRPILDRVRASVAASQTTRPATPRQD